MHFRLKKVSGKLGRHDVTSHDDRRSGTVTWDSEADFRSRLTTVIVTSLAWLQLMWMMMMVHAWDLRQGRLVCQCWFWRENRVRKW